MKHKVENTLYTKDSETGCIVNTDTTGYKARRKVIEKTRLNDDRIVKLEQSFSELSAKLDKILEVITTWPIY